MLVEWNEGRLDALRVRRSYRKHGIRQSGTIIFCGKLDKYSEQGVGLVRKGKGREEQ